MIANVNLNNVTPRTPTPLQRMGAKTVDTSWRGDTIRAVHAKKNLKGEKHG
jgi:hypothetical protein